MHLYFKSSQIPELSKLSPKQRQIVKRDCLYPLSQRPAFFISSHVTTVAAILLGLYSNHALKFGFWTSALAMGFCVFGIGYLHDMIWMARWRPWIRRYVEDQKELAKLQAGVLNQ
jgi:hypothetical protein